MGYIQCVRKFDVSQTIVPVSAFMVKNVITIGPLNTIEEAAKILYEKNVGSLMVLDNEKLVGIITEIDIVAGTLIFGRKKNSHVEDIMTFPIVHVKPDTSIIEAATIMTEKKIHKLPVLDDGKLVGLISASDLVVLFSMSKESDLAKILGAQIGS